MKMNKIKKREILINLLLILSGSFILAFGIYNIHSISPVSEGGVIGLTLFIEHYLSISPSISNFVLTAICYLIGFKALGKSFIVYSSFSAFFYSVFYYILEQFPRVYPDIAEMPLLAALVGALFVGVGVGLCVRAGGAPTGDDAIAMSFSKLFSKDIRIIYIISDFLVILLSVTYIRWQELIFSVITVILSGQLIGLVSKKDDKHNTKSEDKV